MLCLVAHAVICNSLNCLSQTCVLMVKFNHLYADCNQLQAHSEPGCAAHLQCRYLRRCGKWTFRPGHAGMHARISTTTSVRLTSSCTTCPAFQQLPSKMTILSHCHAGAKDRLHELLQIVQSRRGSSVRRKHNASVAQVLPHTPCQVYCAACCTDSASKHVSGRGT